MNAESLIQAVRDRFPSAVESSHAFRGDATLVLRRESLLEVARTLKQDPAFQMGFLVDITAVDYSAFGKKPSPAFFASSGVGVRPKAEIPDENPWPGPPSSARFAVVYHFYSLALKHRLRLTVPVAEENPEVDSLTSALGRRRLARARGLGHVRNPLPGTSGPEAHPDVRGVRGPRAAEGLPGQEAAAADWPGELEAMPETREMLLNVGPAHPAMHGIIRIVTKLDGEQIVDCDVEIGYLHRGFEKMSETVDYNGVMPYTDRLNYVSPLINNMGYCMAVEKALGITVPDRCHYIRVIMSEISRITDHLTCIGAGAMELGAFTVFLYMIKAREYLWELVEMVTGARLTVSYCRVGGVKGDLPEGFEAQCRKAIEETRKVLKESDALLTRNRIFVDRMSGTGKISAEDAISYGITGPFLRGSGPDYDVRKDCPYAVYDRLDFDVPVGTRGDNLDRYLVRMEEMHQSMRMIEQALRDIPPGPFLTNPETGRAIPAAEMVDLAKMGNIVQIEGARAVVDPTLDGASEDGAPEHRRARKARLPPCQGRHLRQHRRFDESLQAGHVRARRAAAEGRGLFPRGRRERGARFLRGERRHE